MKRFIHILICTIAFAFTSCKDESVTDTIWGDGNAKISATLDFRPMSTGLAQTKAAGDALKDINSLHVLLYDGKTSELVYSQAITEYTDIEVPRNDEDAENNKLAESQTKQLSFTLNDIPFGQYYIYAVANIPDLLTNYAENIKTVDGLKNIPLTWDNTKNAETGKYNVANNGQMIGYFTKSNVAQEETVPLVLNEPTINLHAWLRRAASKVTVAFDGSKLKEGVFIYIESVQIKDIPSHCYLGKDNNVGQEGYTLPCPKNGPDMDDGETIIYHADGNHNSDNFEYGEDCVDHRVTVGAPYLGSHEETAQALYFYENMQGEGEDMPDKRQDANNDKVLDHPGLTDDPIKYPQYRLKDNVPYGTYIEVKGHYVSNNSERLGNGPIIYRFMLGQDVEKNYNAKRNCHYKLTLQFKNFANDADWHIEYEEPEPGVMTPAPYYISYLYNHSMMYPFKVNTGGRNIEYIKAEIIENNWAPHNAPNSVYYTGTDGKAAPWNGFLSLHKTTETVLPQPSGKEDNNMNKKYYETAPKRGVREYTNFEEGEHLTKSIEDVLPNLDEETKKLYEQDKYRVEKHKTEANTYNIYIPMYTRAKQMIIKSGYTGNNPYVAYQREAKIKITTKLKGIDKAFENIVPIYQVRRVVNPKGIYRSAGNDKSFHVVLKRLPGEDETQFKTFQSEGPWKAYIVKGTAGHGVSLSPTPGKSESKADDEYGSAIHGKTGSVIDFNVNFTKGSLESNRYAIIRVEYHNYTCQHLIFVRQGDQPDDLIDGGTKWYAMNMRTKSALASTPLDEGSLFKFGNWDNPIDALSNKNPKTPWTNVISTDFKAAGDLTNAATKQNMTWENITNKQKTETFNAPSQQLQGKKARIATAADYWALRTHNNIEQGFGVLYGDDATETADNIEIAYSYDYENNTKGRGMRGCFVYNSDTGKNLFFPIGASGYGHRKQIYSSSWGDPETLNGVLRYACGRTNYYLESTIVYRPLFYDIFRRPGAIYWWNQQETIIDIFDNNTPKKGLGWDINYFSFDFNIIETTNVMRGTEPSPLLSDACFIRCVVDE